MNPKRRGISLVEMVTAIAIGSLVTSLFATWYVRLHHVNRQMEVESIHRRSLDQLGEHLVRDCREATMFTTHSNGSILLQGVGTVEYSSQEISFSDAFCDELGNPVRTRRLSVTLVVSLERRSAAVSRSITWRLETIEPAKPWRQGKLWQVRATLAVESNLKDENRESSKIHGVARMEAKERLFARGWLATDSGRDRLDDVCGGAGAGQPALATRV